jgi:RHS repeat-associated protein
MTMSISTGQGSQPYKFTGKELDMEHGANLYDFEARTYDPATGRFLSIDPMAEKYYNISPYAYCANNPLNRIDPTGMDDYYNEYGKLLYTDTRTTNDMRTLSNDAWASINKEYASQIKDRSTSYSDLINTLDGNSSIITFENAGSEFADMWSSSVSSGKETAGLLLFDFENATVSFEQIEVKNADATGGYISQVEGSTYNGKIVLGNVHTHPTEANFLGKVAADTRQSITDAYNFNNQYSTDNADGNRAERWQGANYTVSKFNVDYYSRQGKSSSVNNLTTREKLQTNKFNLLKYSLIQHGK